MKLFISVLKRLFFVCGLFLWWTTWCQKAFEYGDYKSSIGVSYSSLLWIPTVILLAHVIIYNFYTWFTTLLLYAILFTAFLWETYKDYEIYNDSAKGYLDTPGSWIALIITIVFLLLIGFLIWKMKPIKSV